MRKRRAMSPRRAATTAAGRRRVSTSPVGRAVRRTTGPVQEEEVLVGRGRRGGCGRTPPACRSPLALARPNRSARPNRLGRSLMRPGDEAPPAMMRPGDEAPGDEAPQVMKRPDDEAPPAMKRPDDEAPGDDDAPTCLPTFAVAAHGERPRLPQCDTRSPRPPRAGTSLTCAGQAQRAQPPARSRSHPTAPPSPSSSP